MSHARANRQMEEGSDGGIFRVLERANIKCTACTTCEYVGRKISKYPPAILQRGPVMSSASLGRHLPANLVLIRSNGCSISVEITPPDIPATKCSYFKWLRSLVLATGVPLLVFIGDIFPMTGCCCCWSFVTDPPPPVEDPVASFVTLAILGHVC